MSRKPRPLSRDAVGFRDGRLFLIACDDTYAPKQYFDFFRLPRVQVHTVPTEDGTSTALAVLNRLREIEFEDGDERWLLLDTDHCLKGGHFNHFIKAITEAKNEGVKVALSRPCFEIWLILHHSEESALKHIENASDAEKFLRALLKSYNKTRLVEGDFPLHRVAEACVRATRLDASIAGGDIPEENTTRVYFLIREIVKSTLPSAIPHEVRKRILG